MLMVPAYASWCLQSLSSDNPKNDTFLKSAYWFHQASSNLNSDTAATIVALATSLECLIDKSSETCKVCEQKKYSITQKVKAFVQEYGSPILTKDPELISLIGYFYGVRSDIVHGNELPIMNIPNGRCFDPIINKITDNISYYIFVVRAVILNWYMDKQLEGELMLVQKYKWLPHKAIKQQFTFFIPGNSDSTNV